MSLLPIKVRKQLSNWQVFNPSIEELNTTLVYFQLVLEVRSFDLSFSWLVWGLKVKAKCWFEEMIALPPFLELQLKSLDNANSLHFYFYFEDSFCHLVFEADTGCSEAILHGCCNVVPMNGWGSLRCWKSKWGSIMKSPLSYVPSPIFLFSRRRG